MSSAERPIAGKTVLKIISPLVLEIINRLLGDATEVVRCVEHSAQGKSTHWVIRRRIGRPEHGPAPYNTGDA